MINNYISTASRWLFLFGLLISQTLFAQMAPVIQWQKLASGPIRQAANGDIILGSGTTVSRLNQDTGASIWQTTLPDGFESNIVYDLVIASDGSIVTLTKDRTKWSLIKLDANGVVVWNKSFTGASQSGELFQRFITNVVQGKDGNYVVMGYNSFPRAGSNTELYQLGTDGATLKSGGASYSYPNATRPSSVGKKIIATTDGGFLLVGGTDSGTEPSSVGWAAKLDQNLTQTWTDRYNFASNFTDVIPNPFNPAAFVASGTSLDRTGTVTLVISQTQPGVNNTAGTYRPSLSYVTLTSFPYDGTTSGRSVDPKIVSSSSNSYEVIDAIDQRSGDIRITSFASNNQTRWTKILGGSLADVATNTITTSDGDYLLTALTQSIDSDVQGKTDNRVSGWLVKLAPGTTLTLTQPTYNCSTGAITFNYTGGDGSPITYSAPGIMRSSATSNTGTVEQGLRNDPKTIMITALQSGQTATYGFDFKSFCSGNPPTPTPPTTGSGLVLTQPTYNCSTGAITFNYTGGNGSPVEFQAVGITGWTTNPNQFVDKDSRTANDVKPFTLMARQNGQVVTYTWDLKAACGRSARVASAEAGQGLQLTVKGNPVGTTAIVDISGVEGQPVQLDLLNASGHVLEQRRIEQAGTLDEQRFDLQRQSSGLLLLRVQSGQQRQTIKLIKQ